LSGQSRQVDGRFFFILRYFCPKSNAGKGLRRAETREGILFRPIRFGTVHTFKSAFRPENGTQTAFLVECIRGKGLITIKKIK